jgi:hypothetical protein
VPQLDIIVNESQTFTPHFEPIDSRSVRPGDVVFSRIQVSSDESEGVWFELEVARPEGVDLRGWRITDNDTKSASDEGSLVFPRQAAFADVPGGTTILVVVTETADNDVFFPHDDLSAWDHRMVLYVGNQNLDTSTDPWFNLTADDALVLLAPGPTSAFGDDQGVAFAPVRDYNRIAVTPASFGILTDGVTTGMPTVYP